MSGALSAAELSSFEELYRRIEQLPNGVTGEILEPGVLRTMGRPGLPHRHAGKVLTRDLGSVDRIRGGAWWIEVEAEIRFSRSRLAVPDLSGWRADRLPEGPHENPIALFPDWCCEILSPRTARDDRLLKLPMYVECGVGHVWLVDPQQRSVEVYVPRDGLPLLLRAAFDDVEIALAPFDLPIALGALWLPPGEQRA